MPRYIVERDFPNGLHISLDRKGAEVCDLVGMRNAELGVHWIHSYVTLDKGKSFCVYDAPSADAIRQAAAKNSLPVNTVTEVRVMDPYFYF